MPREGATAGGGGGDRRLQLLADEGFLHGDVASLGEGLDMRTEIAVGGAGQLLQAAGIPSQLTAEARSARPRSSTAAAGG